MTFLTRLPKLMVGFALPGVPVIAQAQETENATAIAGLASTADIVWILVAAALVMMMQIGFMLLEAGMVRSKNSINVAQKNLLDFIFSILVFGAVGFMFTFGAGSAFLPIGIDGNLFMLGSLDPYMAAFFVFQVMFCGTAATIVSGAVAERMKLPAYVLGSVVVAGFIYPVFAHWAWGTALGPSDGALLANIGFIDFAGSTVVHATGAWVALAACLVLGPRLGRFKPDGEPVRIAGHNPVLATAGALLLFFGWIGFNGGSTVAASPDIAHIILNTIVAGAVGGAAGYGVGWLQDGVILPEKATCGMLGGLVAVTAGCMVLKAPGAALVGLLGGFAAVYGNAFLEQNLKLDDAVGAIGVHGIAGVVGTLALALIAPAANLPLSRLDQLGVQAMGVGLNFVWSFGLGLAFFFVLDKLLPVRVDTKSEETGLNEAEHATRLGIGHVEQAIGALVHGTAGLDTRLDVEPGDEAEQLTRLFNTLMNNLQHEETERSRALDARRSDEEAERLTALADATFEALCISVEGEIIDGNQALERLVGRPMSELVGVRLTELFVPADRNKINDRLANSATDPAELSMQGANGEVIPTEVRGRDIIYRGTRTRVSAMIDLRDRKKAEDRIRFLAQHDPLTDLPNRALFNDRLVAMIKHTIKTGTPSAVLLVDLDRFKDINDLHGHPAGDEVIKVTAGRLRQLVRADDMVARLGGDEFAILQARVEFPSQAEELAHRIVHELAKPIEVAQGIRIRVGASVGVAICPRDGLQDVQLVSRADTALYQAKNNGRNQYALFEPGMDAELRRRQTLDADLLPALENGEFKLWFQPRMDLSTGEIVSYEALIRWQHPKSGLINPADFIPVAEHSGKIVQIGSWVLDEACRLAASSLDGRAVSVNVSPVQFRDRHFIETVSRALDKSGLSPDRLEIEITESVLIDDVERAVSLLKDLKLLGIRIALDDFGTGYSSLSYLSRFPFNTIKIDRAFLKDLRADKDALAIVDTIIRLGRALQMNIVAEGVEHETEVGLLASRGCHEIQGFVLGRPQPLSDLATIPPPGVLTAISATDSGPAALRRAASRMKSAADRPKISRTRKRKKSA